MVPYRMANSWFSPHGSKREGISRMSQPAMMRCETGMLKPTQPRKESGRSCSARRICCSYSGTPLPNITTCTHGSCSMHALMCPLIQFLHHACMHTCMPSFLSFIHASFCACVVSVALFLQLAAERNAFNHAIISLYSCLVVEIAEQYQVKFSSHHCMPKAALTFHKYTHSR